jgi:hypothetical protein
MQKGSQQAESKGLPEEVFLRCHRSIFGKEKRPPEAVNFVYMSFLPLSPTPLPA